MAWYLIIGVVGVILGWLIRGFSAPKRRDVLEYEERTQRAERRVRSVATERDDEHSSVLTLRAALQSERQLLDGVANHAGVEPEMFRKTISREYLGRELVVSPASLVDFDFGSNAAGESDSESLHSQLAAQHSQLAAQQSQLAAQQSQLAAKDSQLADAREQIQRIRADIEALTGGDRPREQVGVMAVMDAPARSADAVTERVSGVDNSDATLDVRTDPAVIDLSNGGNSDACNSDGEAALVSTDHVRFLESRAASAQVLEEEVAALRARLADIVVASDDMRARIEYRRGLDDQLVGIVDQLETLRRRVVAEQPAAPLHEIVSDRTVLDRTVR